MHIVVSNESIPFGPEAEGRRCLPLRIAVAAACYGLTVGCLRTEAKRGNLITWRVAGKIWTSHSAIERMFEKCRVRAEGQGCGFEPLAEKAAARNQRSGLSEAEDVSLALASARTTARKLR